jgi:hypothetical protein
LADEHVPVVDSAVVLPKMAFVTVWELENLGEPHPVIGPNNYYMTDEFRAELHRHTYASLEELGLAAEGLVSEELRRTMHVIASSDRQFYGWSSTAHGGDDAILVAALGRDAVRIATDDEVILLDPIPAETLTEHFVEALPEVPAAHVMPVTVPESQLDDPSGFTNSSPLAQLADTGPVDYLNNVMRAQRDAVHQLYAAVRGRSGERRRSMPLSAIDLTGQGRVFTFLNKHPKTGQKQINLLPGTPANLISVLEATCGNL